MPAGPCHPLLASDLQEQVELLGEQGVVIVEIVAEQREGLDERAPARHDLGASTRQKVEGRKALEHPDRIVGAQHGYGAREADPFRALGGGRQHDGRGGDHIVGPVMFAEAEHVQADLIGQLDLLDEIAQALRRGDPIFGDSIFRQLAEGIDTKFH
jgi:hypothetical protein